MREELDVPRETKARWEIYETALRAWQPRINLISASTLDDTYTRHFLDSLQVSRFVHDKKSRIFDIGSGAGFPGLVLAMAEYTNVHLIEADKRKAAFLREVASLLKLDVKIYGQRIEKVKIENPEFVVSRAVAPLGDLLERIVSHLSPTTTCLFHKGRDYAKEIEVARQSWTFDCHAHPSLVDPEGVILEMKGIKEV